MNSVNQSKASARGDIVAGNKTTIVNTYGTRPNVLEVLLQKLQHEIENNETIRTTVENLQYFAAKRKAPDGIEGLEAKLMAGSRTDEITDALEMKEAFAKLLERWSLYASAQEIFAFLLAKIRHEFTYSVFPRINEISRADVNEIITDRIVEPTINDCGVGAFSLNHHQVMGMIYWLAEQCFVRWHK